MAFENITWDEMIARDVQFEKDWTAANPVPPYNAFDPNAFYAHAAYTDRFTTARLANLKSFLTAEEFQIFSNWMNSRTGGGFGLGGFDKVIASFRSNPFANIINPVVTQQIENPKETAIATAAILGAAALAGAGTAAGAGSAVADGTLAGSSGLLTGAAEAAPVALLPDATKYLDTLLDTAEQYVINEVVGGLQPKKSGPAASGGDVYTPPPAAPKTYTTELALGLIAASALLFLI